jgi:hypothetical protein
MTGDTVPKEHPEDFEHVRCPACDGVTDLEELELVERPPRGPRVPSRVDDLGRATAWVEAEDETAAAHWDPRVWSSEA